MKKKLLVLLLAAVMLFALSACEVSSSSTSTTTVSTSYTDADGNTTSNTVTNEVGVSAGSDGVSFTNETTHSDGSEEAEPVELTEEEEEMVAAWRANFSEGAEGEDGSGDWITFAWDDADDIGYALVVIEEPDGYVSSVQGEVEVQEDGTAIIYDAGKDRTLQFQIGESFDDGFEFIFVGDGDVAELSFVDQDTLVNDLLNLVRSIEPAA